jgi:hypothetical protein
MEEAMSLPAIETAVILLGLGMLIGLCRRVGPRDVMRLLGDALLPFGGNARSGRGR